MSQPPDEPTSRDSERIDTHNPPDVELWVETHADLLFRYAMTHVGNRHMAEDLVQETFLVALQKSSEFAGRSKVSTWLVGILRNKIGALRRKGGREKVESEIRSDDADPTSSFFDKHGHWKQRSDVLQPADEIERREMMTILQQCIQNLPKNLGETYMLRELEGLETPEICDCLEITESNFSVRMHRARLLLRRCLELNWLRGKAGGPG